MQERYFSGVTRTFRHCKLLQMPASRSTEHWEKGEVPVGLPTGTSIKMRVSVENLTDTKRNPSGLVGGPTGTHRKT